MRGSQWWHGSRGCVFQTSFSLSLSQWYKQAETLRNCHINPPCYWRTHMHMLVPVWWSGLPVYFENLMMLCVIILGWFEWVLNFRRYVKFCKWIDHILMHHKHKPKKDQQAYLWPHTHTNTHTTSGTETTVFFDTNFKNCLSDCSNLRNLNIKKIYMWINNCFLLFIVFNCTFCTNNSINFLFVDHWINSSSWIPHLTWPKFAFPVI